MYQVYKVMSDDTLESLSSKINVSCEELCRLNGFDSVVPGEYIVIPSSDNMYFSYVVKPGDTIYSVSQMYNVSPSILSFINGIDDGDFIYPNQTLIIPNNDVFTYVTVDGDSFNSILKKTGVSFDSLFKNISDLHFMPEQIVFYKRD